jgi:peptidoglycan-associated lipoprotein
MKIFRTKSSIAIVTLLLFISYFTGCAPREAVRTEQGTAEQTEGVKIQEKGGEMLEASESASREGEDKAAKVEDEKAPGDMPSEGNEPDQGLVKGKTAIEETSVEVGSIEEERIVSTPETGQKEKEIGRAISKALEKMVEMSRLPEDKGRITEAGPTGPVMDKGLTGKGQTESSAEEVGGLLPVYFDFDKYSLREDAKTIMRNNAEWLMRHQPVKVLIEGHADERGPNEYNLALGEKRARSVLNYLSAFGIKTEFITISYGEEKPVCTEHSEECWARNRRADFKVISGNE